MDESSSSTTPLIDPTSIQQNEYTPIDIQCISSDPNSSSGTTPLCNVFVSVITFSFETIIFLVKKLVQLFFLILISPASFIVLITLSIALRLLQFFKHGDSYDRVVHVRIRVNIWILIFTILTSVQVAIILYLMDVYELLHFGFLGEMPILVWVEVWRCIASFCFSIPLAYVLSFLVSTFFSNYINESALFVPEAVFEIVSSLSLFMTCSSINGVLELNHYYDDNNHRLLVLDILEEFISVTPFFLIGYNLLKLLINFTVGLMRLFYKDLDPETTTITSLHISLAHLILDSKLLMYVIYGVKNSIQFIFSSLWLFTTLYIFYWPPPSDTQEIDEEKQFLQFITNTCLSITLCSLLWPFKTYLTLVWKAQSVYGKLSLQIVKTAKELYFLGIIGRHKFDILNVRYDRVSLTKGRFGFLLDIIKVELFVSNRVNRYNNWNHEDDEEDELGERSDQEEFIVQKLSTNIRNRSRDELLNLKKDETFNIYGIQQAAHHFLAAENALMNENYTSHIINHLKAISDNSRYANNNINEILKQLIVSGRAPEEERERNEWDQFLELLNPESSQEISDEHIKRWMDRAQHNCLLLANALSGAEEVGKYLDKIMSCSLIFAIFIFWLLLTGLANTTALVLVASPLLAVTFVFGDTCKTFFQGIIFVYVVHPYDIGDLCVIEEKRMVVRAIDIWRTTFLELNQFGSEESILIYPNSMLANIKINYPKTEFDWDDEVLFDLGTLNKSKIDTLKEKVENYIDDGKDEFKISCYKVEMCEERTKLRILLKYNILRVQEGTYFDYRQHREILRDALIPRMQIHVNECFELIESTAPASP